MFSLRITNPLWAPWNWLTGFNSETGVPIWGKENEAFQYRDETVAEGIMLRFVKVTGVKLEIVPVERRTLPENLPYLTNDYSGRPNSFDNPMQ